MQSTHFLFALKKRSVRKTSASAASQVRELHSDGLEEAVREFRVLQVEVLSFLDEDPMDSPARGWYMPESDYYFYSADKAKWWQEEYAPALPF